MSNGPFSTPQITRDAADVFDQEMRSGKGAAAGRIHQQRHGRYPTSVPDAKTRKGISRRQMVKYRKGARGLAKKIPGFGVAIGVADYLLNPEELGESTVDAHRRFRADDWVRIQEALLQVNNSSPETAAQLLDKLDEIQKIAREKQVSPYTLLPLQYDEEGKDVSHGKHAMWIKNKDYGVGNQLLDKFGEVSGLHSISSGENPTSEAHLETFLSRIKEAYPQEEAGLVDKILGTLEAQDAATATALIASGEFRRKTPEEANLPVREATWGEALSGPAKGMDIPVLTGNGTEFALDRG